MPGEWEGSGGGGGGGGSTETASNIGTAGVGVYKQKTGVNFEFKKINAGSNKVTITDDTSNNEVDINVAEANLTLGNMGGTVGSSQIASNAITTVKITDANVTNAKIQDGAICTSKIGDDCVTLPKLVNMTDQTILGRAAGSSGDPQELSVSGGLKLANTQLYIDYLEHAKTHVGFIDDFFGDVASGVTTGNFEQNSAGTGATISPIVVAETGVFGIWELRVGTTTTGRAALFGGNNLGYMLLGQGVMQIETKIRIPTLSDATDTFKVLFGFLGAADTATVNDGVYFEYISTSSANWRTCASNDGVRTQNNSSTVVPANTWVKLKIVVNAGGTSVDYLVNGTVIDTITTNLPSGTGDPVSCMLGILKSAGTTDRSINTDYIAFDLKLTTPR